MERIFIEIVKDFDNLYYANITLNGNSVKGLPEYVGYVELKKAVKEKLGYTLPNLKDLKFEKSGRKCYAHIEDYI